MPKDVFRWTPAFSNFERLLGKSKSGVVILVGLALMAVPPQFAFGQMTQQQQQEQQQREEQQRQEQQREEQAREQQQREQQDREEQQHQEQQREEQQREEQAREQQQREQQDREEQQRQEQQREEQQREEQAREQQQREQQAREVQQREQQEQQQREQQAHEQQQRDEQQREEQERQPQTPGTPVHSPTVASPSVNSQVTGSVPTGSQVSNDTRRTPTRTQALEPAGRINAAGSDREKTAPKSQDLRLPASDLQRTPCDKEPCKEPGPKPVPPDLRPKLCKDGPCPVCAPGQSPGKDNSCVSATLAKGATAPPKPSVVPQSCPAGQIWNGVQCAPVGAQQCLPGQTKVGSFCQSDCTIATAGAQNYIELLRMARQDKDNACTQNPTGDECRSTGITYDMRLNEYRNYLGGVPTECTLPDPIS